LGDINGATMDRRHPDVMCFSGYGKHPLKHNTIMSASGCALR
jgi:hypothetical protein